MSGVGRWVVIGIGALIATALVVTGIERALERQRVASEVERLREGLYRARVASDRCRGSLTNSEASIRSLTNTIDSLRSRVDSFEALDVRGVPEERYDDYMLAFESYNDSVSVWEARERRLRAAEESCRATIRSHNAISDTLQDLLAGPAPEEVDG